MDSDLENRAFVAVFKARHSRRSACLPGFYRSAKAS
jgi:hypothetical protein